ncbi:hypothetical protein KBI33_00790 [Candidatus Shapirobacteria bacterium]|nr:hypothetical protein [Candidatus Shapirobacteria bacterium]
MTTKKTSKAFPFDYLVLALILASATILFLYFPPLSGKREIAAVSLGIFYFLWGVWYHNRRGDLVLKIILEYLAVAALGVTALLILL